jgi:hypothetical protein
MRTVVALSANSRMRCRQPPARGAERIVVADDANFDDGPGSLAGLRHGGDGARLGAPPFGIGGVFDIGACEDEPAAPLRPLREVRPMFQPLAALACSFEQIVW